MAAVLWTISTGTDAARNTASAVLPRRSRWYQGLPCVPRTTKSQAVLPRCSRIRWWARPSRSTISVAIPVQYCSTRHANSSRAVCSYLLRHSAKVVAVPGGPPKAGRCLSSSKDSFTCNRVRQLPVACASTTAHFTTGAAFSSISTGARIFCTRSISKSPLFPGAPFS